MAQRKARATSTAGFTLAELLVVISIIGLLASVILASLSSARTKGADAAVAANLANIRAQAAIIYDNTNSYANLCDDSVVIAAMQQAAKAAGFAYITPATYGNPQNATNHIACHVNSATPNAYAIQASLRSGINGGNGNSWCIDDTGVSKWEAAYMTNVNATSCL